MEKIAEALKSSSTKKENLRKAFDSVKFNSSSLNSFTLQWSDLEQHFDSLQKSLEKRFKQLKTKEEQHEEQQPESSMVNSDLKLLCVEMDGLGLRSFVMESWKDLPMTREEVKSALQSAPYPAKLVLDALQGFYPLKPKKARDRASKLELGTIRRTCVLLLEGLAVLGPEINTQVKGDAKKLAVDWKDRVNTDSNDQLEALVFLQLLGTYGLQAEFDVNELLDLLVSVARRKQAVDLFRGLGFHDKISDFVHKLTNTGKQIDAIKFIYAFNIVNKFPPVPLLKLYFQQAKKVAEETRRKGNYSPQSHNEAIAKETAYLQAILKCIEEHNLESQYPPRIIEMRIEEIEKQKQKVEKKHSTTTPVVFPEPKRPCFTGSDYGLPTPTFPNPKPNPYLSGSVEQVSPYYGLSRTTAPTFSSYMNGANPNPNPYLSDIESELPSSRDLGVGGHRLLPLYRSMFPTQF